MCADSSVLFGVMRLIQLGNQLRIQVFDSATAPISVRRRDPETKQLLKQSGVQPGFAGNLANRNIPKLNLRKWQVGSKCLSVARQRHGAFSTDSDCRPLGAGSQPKLQVNRENRGQLSKLTLKLARFEAP